MSLEAVIGILIILLIATLIYAIKTAPLGYEDENGFHYESENQKEKFEEEIKEWTLKYEALSELYEEERNLNKLLEQSLNKEKILKKSIEHAFSEVNKKYNLLISGVGAMNNDSGGSKIKLDTPQSLASEKLEKCLEQE